MSGGTGTVFLYGAGGHAKVVLDVLRARGIFPSCVCDDAPEAASEFCGLPVLRGTAAPAGAAIVSIGKSEARREIVEFLRSRGDVEFLTAVHPSAVVSPSARLGAGTVVMPGALVNAEAVVGEHCIVNTGASIDHDCRIGDFSHIAPHATLCGNVSVGEGTWIGAGATVIQGVSIGKRCFVGAGTVVAKDLPDGAFACTERKLFVKASQNTPPPFGGGKSAAR